MRKYLENEEMFLANYADILTDLDLDDMIGKFRASDAVGGFCAVTPPYSFHLVTLRAGENGKVERMMSLQESGTLMNGGYLVLRPEIFDNLHEGEELVVEGFARLVEQNRLYAHRHDGFWMPMDTFKEKQALDDMVQRGDTPWQVWKAPQGRMRALRWPDLGCILCLGAHSDDIEIGAGATVLRLVRENPRARVVWVVLAAAGAARRRGPRLGGALPRRGGGRAGGGGAAGVPRRALPGAVGRDQGLLRDAEAPSRPTSCSPTTARTCTRTTGWFPSSPGTPSATS